MKKDKKVEIITLGPKQVKDIPSDVAKKWLLSGEVREYVAPADLKEQEAKAEAEAKALKEEIITLETENKALAAEIEKIKAENAKLKEKANKDKE